MRKAVGVILLIFVLSLVIYVLFFRTMEGRSTRDIEFVSETDIHTLYTIRQIDSLTADLNYEFTIKNKVTHPVRSDSLMIPRKGESPAG